VRITVTILLALTLILTVAGCHCGSDDPEPEATPEPVEEGEQANTPKLIAAATPAVTPVEVDAPKDAFQVNIEHALLFDPRTGPINAAHSDEVGVHLLVAGKITNKTGRLLHRAAIYATLIAQFSEKTELERHSGGMGFSPRITSLDPWRPDTERSFICITRPLDPIYFELVPEKLMAALTVQARDPLEYRFRGEVAKLQVGWDTIFGTATGGTATVIVDGSGSGAPQQYRKTLSRGDVVKVLYQRGLAFKVINDEGRLFWLGYKALALHNNEPDKPADWAKTRFPVHGQVSDDLFVRISRVAEFDAHEGVDTDQKIYRIEMEFTNRGDRPRRTPSREAFALDIAAGGYTRALRAKPGTTGIYAPTTLKPGETIGGALLFEHANGDFPFDLEIHQNGQPPARIPLFPALLAVQNNGT